VVICALDDRTRDNRPVTTSRWTVVVPVKAAPVAKSRLAVPEGLRAAYARAFAADTVAAAVGCTSVRRVVVVSDDSQLGAALVTLGAELLVRALPLNAAISAAADAEHGPVAALPADLPALVPTELAAALAAAAAHPRAVVPDRRGTGTVLLTARSGPELGPAFGPDSFRSHRSGGAVPLEDIGWARLRCDVDTAEDLAEAARLGVGPATARLLQG
jgi:2-phospho-L-lactate guanylyltransferase